MTTVMEIKCVKYIKNSIKGILIFLPILFFTCTYISMARADNEASQSNYNTLKPSFDCSKATEEVEKTICQSSALGYLDKQVAKNFLAAQKFLPSDKQKQLLHEQREWLKKRPADLQTLSNMYKVRNFQLIYAYDIVDNDTLFDVTGNVEFADFIVHGKVNITSKLLNKLSYAKIDGNGQFPEGLDSMDHKVMVQNCHDYWRYDVVAKDGSTSDMAMADVFKDTCGILEKLQNIQKPQQSFMDGIYLFDAKYLPLTLLPLFGGEDADQIKKYEEQGINLQKLIAKGDVSLEQKSNDIIGDSVMLSWGRELYDPYSLIDEIVRGDFTGDGIESMLIRKYTKSGGTLSFVQTCLLTKKRHDAELKLEEECQ